MTSSETTAVTAAHSKTDDLALIRAAESAARAIPPAWPLASSVAVNPFLGQIDEDIATAGARLARVAGASVTMPRAWRQAQLASGEITDQHLLDALADAPTELRPADLASLKVEFAAEASPARALPTIADLAAEASGIDWPGVIAERIGAWAAGYFDEGQALWAAPRGKGAYTAWRAVATHDLTPEILGLSGFARHVADAPDSATTLLIEAAERLDLNPVAAETYFHRLLTTLGGWAQYARYKLWQAERLGETDDVILHLLAIRLIWEDAIFVQYAPQIAEAWAGMREAHGTPVAPTRSLVVDAIIQDAAERAAQGDIAARLAQPPAKSEPNRPLLQAAFCIDVRSEVFRRALETVNPAIQTLGFAGFFGVATAYTPFASDIEELRLPVLLPPALHACAGGKATGVKEQYARVKARAKRAWGRFKLAAVSSFAFVEATGPVYAAKLLGDALALSSESVDRAPAPRFIPELDLTDRVSLAERVLSGMSLKSGFARLVILAGHGAQLVNNPQASGLQCGACGGYSGEVNARLLAALLNDAEVRSGLASRGIAIPIDTVFVAALHDTVTDDVRLYADDHPTPSHQNDLDQAQTWLEAAGRLARADRAPSFPSAPRAKALLRRGLDWAQVRPEWGLARCKAFIAAPRARTAGKDFQGRVFLHDYDWRLDDGFRTLELILTAPVVVASWISLQYYGSTVAPQVFGGGNKLLHNIAGGIGVVEGNGGLLRFGLPLQSVHDGARYIHDPLRLTVCVEAPRDAITDVLARHEGLRSLFDHRWMHLLAMDDSGRLAWRYGGDLQWKAMQAV